MVADSHHREKNVQNREKTFRIEKKILEYRNIFHDQKKKKKKKMKSRKKIKFKKNILESRKIFHRIEKTISKLRKMFKNQKIFSTFKLTSHVRGLSTKSEKCDLLTTP